MHKPAPHAQVRRLGLIRGGRHCQHLNGNDSGYDADGVCVVLNY